MLHSDPAFCLQVHGGNEGLYTHQMAHLFFMAAMVFLSYILFRHPLGHGKGWTYLKFSLLFFFLWNINAFITHGLELDIPPNAMLQEGPLPHALCIPVNFKIYIYYLGKFDHLLCVPAMFCLAMALRSFCIEVKERSQRDREDAV
ncbi:MAG: hypothetical protein ABWK15_09255 [Dissulfuribacterales bacterium]